MEWLKKLFGGKKQEMPKEAPLNSPQAPEMPMGGMPVNKPTNNAGMADQSGSEDLK